jgi:hypothetical protein
MNQTNIIKKYFKEWIELNEPFVSFIQNGDTYWDFNSCIWGKQGDSKLVAVAEGNKKIFLEMGFKIVDTHRGVVLLEKL